MEEEAQMLKEAEESTATVPEVEVHLYLRGEGPVHVFKSRLGGWDQDKLDLQQIMDDYGLKTLYAFGANSGRGVRLRFNSRNGLSMLSYRGGLVRIDGDPKDPLIKPITKILLVLALVAILVSVALREEPPMWVHKFQAMGGTSLAWTVAISAFVFSRIRKKGTELIKRYGWL